MANRFEQGSPRIIQQTFSRLPILLFIFLLVVFLAGINSVQGTTSAKQQEGLETALKRGIIQCYAVEGIYPPDLQYLKDHYGLHYDESVFLVDYECYGSNLMPDVTVLRKRGK